MVRGRFHRKRRNPAGVWKMDCARWRLAIVTLEVRLDDTTFRPGLVRSGVHSASPRVLVHAFPTDAVQRKVCTHADQNCGYVLCVHRPVKRPCVNNGGCCATPILARVRDDQYFDSRARFFDCNFFWILGSSRLA